MNKKDITPRNEKDQEHGYWEKYFSNNQLMFKGNYINGKEHGYWEYYDNNGKLDLSVNYVNGKAHGYCVEYFSNGELNYKGYYDMGVRVDYVVDANNDLITVGVNNDLIFEVI